MCGISGVYISNNCNYCKSIIKKIVEYQKKRGPDSFGIWEYCNAILGHNRLSIIDLSSNGNQPMVDGNRVIVFNGEIYNFLEIRDDLKKNGICFNSTSDTEVLLKSIQFYGIDKTMSIVNGMFAFAYYDKDDDVMILARDRIGLKPLYYTTFNDNLFFSSNIGALIKSISEIGGKQWHLNRDAIYNYLLLGGCSEGETLVKDIHKLESATYMYIKGKDIFKTNYWTPQPNTYDINNLLRNSIMMRKRADVPVSILFSGGIDSSIIGYHCPKYNAIHLCTDELSYATSISKKLGLNLICIEDKETTFDDMEELMTDYINFSGEPSLSSIIPMIVFKKMKQYSTVGISGNGGDELFYGYDRTPILDDNEDHENLYNNLKCRLMPNNHEFTHKDYHLLHIFRHPENFEMIGAENLTYTQLKDKIMSTTKLQNFKPESLYRWIELDTYVKNDLNPTLDFASMYYSLEIRVPFLDHRVIERALTLTSDDHIDKNKQFPNNRKILLKNVLSNKLDQSLYNRTKRGFSLPKNLISHFGKIGVNAIEQLKTRKILKWVDFKYGNVGRDKIYFSRSCAALEKWMQLYVDTGYVKDELFVEEKKNIIKKFKESNTYTLNHHLEPYTCYSMIINLLGLDDPTEIIITISDKNRIVSQFWLYESRSRNKNYEHIFNISQNSDITIIIKNTSKDGNKDLFVNKLDIVSHKNATELYHLILFGNYITNDLYLRDYNNIVPQNSNIVVWGDKENDNETLFGFKRHGMMTWKLKETPNFPNKLGIVINEINLDKDFHHMIFAAGYADEKQRSKAFLYVNNYETNIIWNTNSDDLMLKDGIGFISGIVKDHKIRYGIILNNIDNIETETFNISKLCHFKLPLDFSLQWKNVDRYFKIVVVIAFTGRYGILEENVKLLNMQTEDNVGIVLVGSSNNDLNFLKNISSKYNNVYYAMVANNPCGLKWQTGTYYARLFNPDAIMILGSDDLLSLNYIKQFYEYIENGYDLVGKKRWFSISYGDPKIYKVSYTNKVEISLGAGRMYSKKILDKCDWKLFEFLRDRCLDDLGYFSVKKKSGKLFIDNDENVCVLSVKGNWDQFNPFDKIIEASKKDNPSITITSFNDSYWLDSNFGVKNRVKEILNINNNLIDKKILLYYNLSNNKSIKLSELLLDNLIIKGIEVHVVNSLDSDIVCNDWDLGIFLDAASHVNDKIIIKMGLRGIPIICNKNFPNCINYYNNIDYVDYLVDFVLTNYSRYRGEIVDSTVQYMNNDKRRLAVVVIASHKREKILEANIKILKYHKEIDRIIVSVTKDSDINVCKRSGVMYCQTRNQPLGEKWQHGIIMSKMCYPKWIIVVGSDDFIFPGFFDSLLTRSLSKTNFDLYLHNSWIIYDIHNEKYYKVKYKDDNNGVGSGRILKSSILDKINWLFYPIDQSASLDYHSNKKIIDIGGIINIGEDSTDKIILCPKYDTECMNPLQTIIDSSQFDVTPYIIPTHLISYTRVVREGMMDQSEYSRENSEHIITGSHVIPLDHELSVTTSLSKLDIVPHKTATLIISKEIGTPGIYIPTTFLNPNKYYKLEVNYNGNYPLFILLVNKEVGNYITYNKTSVKNGEVIFDTIGIKKFNNLALCTSTPKIGNIVFYSLIIHELEILYK
jgi:asparagine synthase (glutamine-hydrolysing)